MEDAAHCSHKPSSLSLPPALMMGSISLDFLIFSFYSVTCQGSEAFGCDCFNCLKKKRKKKKNSS